MFQISLLRAHRGQHHSCSQSFSKLKANVFRILEESHTEKKASTMTEVGDARQAHADPLSSKHVRGRIRNKIQDAVPVANISIDVDKVGPKVHGTRQFLVVSAPQTSEKKDCTSTKSVLFQDVEEVASLDFSEMSGAIQRLVRRGRHHVKPVEKRAFWKKSRRCRPLHKHLKGQSFDNENYGARSWMFCTVAQSFDSKLSSEESRSFSPEDAMRKREMIPTPKCSPTVGSIESVLCTADFLLEVSIGGQAWESVQPSMKADDPKGLIWEHSKTPLETITSRPKVQPSSRIPLAGDGDILPSLKPILLPNWIARTNTHRQTLVSCSPSFPGIKSKNLVSARKLLSELRMDTDFKYVAMLSAIWEALEMDQEKKESMRQPETIRDIVGKVWSSFAQPSSDSFSNPTVSYPLALAHSTQLDEFIERVEIERVRRMREDVRVEEFVATFDSLYESARSRVM